MEQFCFLQNFPDSAEEKLYIHFGKDFSGKYEIFLGGTYMFVKNDQNRTIRFTHADIKSHSINPEKIEAWIRQLTLRFPTF